MGAGNFFAGLLGGYTGTLVKNEARQYEQDLAAKELRIHSAVTAMDAAMKSGDKNAMGIASQNLDEAIGALQDTGKKKFKQKKDSPHAGLLQSIIGAIGGGGQQQGQQQAPSLGEIPKMPGVQQGAGGMPRDAGIPAGAPAQASPIPPMPQRPVSLASVYQSIPGPEQQAVTSGKASAAESGAKFEALKKQAEQNIGRPLKPDESQRLWEEVSGVVPKNLSMKPVLMTAKAPVTASEAPPNAITADGRPASVLDPKQHVNLWQYPDGRIVAFPAALPPASSASQAITPVSVDGVPTAIKGPQGTFAIGSPDMPADYKPVAQSALKAHAQSRSEHQADAIERDNLMVKRMTYGALDLTDQKKARDLIRKQVDTLEQAKLRLGIMEKLSPRALKGDQQAQLAILANHIGMTLGLQKGARITRAVWEEAMQSSPLLQRVAARFGSDGYLQGVALSHEQIGQMLALGQDSVRNTQQTALDESKQFGIPITTVAPGFYGEGNSSKKSAHKVGDIVTLKDGRRVKITKMLKGGQYKAVAVQ